MTARSQIVCATDFTARSDLALSRAVLLAQQTGARLMLVHAVDRRKPARVLRAQINRAYVQLLSKVDQAFGSAAATIDVTVRAGKPLDAITAVANEADADLLVLAAPQSLRSDAIFGTSAERLLRATHRPVLVVHRPAEDNYRRVAIAVDLSNKSVRMILDAARLGVLHDAQTTLLHAQKHAWQGDAQLRLHAMLTAAEMDIEKTRVLVRTEPPAAAILHVSEREQPELLTIGAGRWLLIKRVLIGSVADRALRTPMWDVLVIPQIPNLRMARAVGSSALRRPTDEHIPFGR
jgi:nucleotide-binding universal stress UspA family protein